MLDKHEFSALRKLLDSVHEYNNQIECLYYFTYTLKKSLEVK